MKDTTLVILAAGLGSRFGGNKQIAQVGPHGEILMEYSIFDAIRAGFTQIVFILKKEMVETVKKEIGDRISHLVRVDYAVQDTDSLPDFYTVPADRVKPFGTVHAVLCAKDVIRAPFATINADDYYGQGAFSLMNALLQELHSAETAGMVPYVLKNTMSENGGVTRGVCRVENGRLCDVVETHDIHYTGDRQIEGEFGTLTGNEAVSMNFWGFHPDLLPVMNEYFDAFLARLAPNEIKAECLLPIMVGDLLSSGRMHVKAVTSHEQWFGITYREDREIVADRLRELHATGVYPERLF